ncbi:MAG: hypothetical protein IGS48_23295 [Oscillatoriales cyanobacterium C42_A2020_001]|nr:hypothetical protein [Leptolyngbyaceae cyanobacterium C42_A2020_001]
MNKETVDRLARHTKTSSRVYFSLEFGNLEAGKIQSQPVQILPGCVEQIKATGLGLAVVKRWVETHRGCIQLASEVGKGTTATVTLGISGAKQ